MTKELFIGAAAVLMLTPAAFAQPAGGATTGALPGPTTAPPAPNVPGVATGVQPYRPAGAPGAGPAGGSGLTASPDTSVSGQIGATLQAGQIPPAGQIPGSDSTTVGGASAGQGLRTPNPSTGTYTGPAGPTYGAPGATPYTGPGTVSGSAGGAPGSAASAPSGPSSGAPGR